MRLVTLAVAQVVLHMLSLGFMAEEVHIRHYLGEVLKALGALRRSLMDTESLRKKLDVVNWEGEGFKYVVGEMVGLFQEAMKEAGVEEYLRHNIMLQFRDLAAMNEDRIRRETKALEK